MLAILSIVPLAAYWQSLCKRHEDKIKIRNQRF
jgi:hypothetical protein